METKLCKYCNEIKETTLFKKGSVRKDGTVGISNICKKCDNLRKYKSLKNNPQGYEKYKERTRIRALRWNERNPEKAREKANNFYHNAAENKKFERYIKNKYNLKVEEYNDLFYSQKKVCAICKKDIELHVDHSHTTGKVRGLLCICCNTALGKFNDSIEMLESAIQYLKKNE